MVAVGACGGLRLWGVSGAGGLPRGLNQGWVAVDDAGPGVGVRRGFGVGSGFERAAMGLGKLSKFTNFKKLQGMSTLGLINAANPPVAIDFGASSLKVLQLSGLEPPTLAAAASLDTPDHFLTNPIKRLEFQIENLPRLVKQAGISGKRAVCAIPAPMTFCKHMQFQKVDGVGMSGLVEAAMSQHLGCDPSLLVFRHVEVGPAAGGKTEVICMATSRDLVGRLMGAIRGARLDPVGMHSEQQAMLRAFDSITKRDSDAALTSLYLDIGFSGTRVAIAHGRDLVFARTVEIGSRHLDEAVARHIKCDLLEGRRLRLEHARQSQRARPEPVGAGVRAGPAGGFADRRSGTPDLAGEAAGMLAPEGCDLRETLEMLTDEIQLSLRYHGSLFPGREVDRVIFVGGEARNRAVCQHIGRVLRAPAQVGDPMARAARTGSEPSVGVDLREAQPGWTVPLGLCMSPTDL